MAIFNIYSRKKTYDGHEFGNRYLVRASNITNAYTAIAPIIEAEKVFHSPGVTFLYARVSDLIEDNDVYYTVPQSGTGSLGDLTQALPSLLALRVDLTVLTGGRPSRKFYHPCLNESYQDQGLWGGTYIVTVENTLSDLISDLQSNTTPLVDPDDQVIGGPVAKQLITHRQWSKRSKRTTSPAP